MEDIEIKKIFFRFLKDEGAFASFKNNFCLQTKRRQKWCEREGGEVFKNKEAESFDSYFNNLVNKKNLIEWAFSWADTKQENWYELDRKWQKRFNNN